MRAHHPDQRLACSSGVGVKRGALLAVAVALLLPGSTAAPTLRPRVVLDPGHGGADSGMVSQWVREADVNLAVAKAARSVLERRGVEVIMTRSDTRALHPDKRTDLDRRARLANTGTVSAFVSIHVNAGSPTARGIETFYFGQPLAGQSRSLAVFENGGGASGEALTRQVTSSAQAVLGDVLAQAKLTFSRQLAQGLQAGLVGATGAVNRGVQTDAFYVIRNPTTPAVLVEVGFGSSPTEGPRLAQAAYQQRLGTAIAESLLRFLHQ